MASFSEDSKVVLYKNSANKSFEDFLSWLSENKKQLLEKLNSSGAIRFTDFPISNSKQFKKCVDTIFGPEDYSYFGGTSPRTKILDGVYSSTNMPFFMKIPLHSEMAYRENRPNFICFYCEEAPLFGGETIISDNREIYKAIPQQLRDELELTGFTFYRKFRKLSPLYSFLNKFNPMIKTTSWDYVFQSSDKSVVEGHLNDQGFEYRWLPGDNLVIQNTIAACSEWNGDMVWSNSAHFFQIHHRIWGHFLTLFYKFFSIILKLDDLSATAGSGRKLTSKEVSQIIDAFEQNRKTYKWRKRDFVLLNNALFSHGRNPYLGKRRIRVALK